jgi:2-keto-4-pentenoate hydratase/2-oxohepta-3-ene-1,7-dioic acid hydratase in catechol pathway
MKIVCIGRNYVDHVKELGNELSTEPVFFMKPESALLPKNHPFYIPDFTKDLHYECELVLRVSKLGKHISEKFALTYIDEIGIGIDFTARDLQNKCKEKGLPWEIAKSWDFSAPVGKFLPIANFQNLRNINFSLNKNSVVVQQGNSGLMIHSFEKIISYVSHFVTLKQGDYIFTGTPSGVGPVSSGDHLEAFIEHEKCFSLMVK